MKYLTLVCLLALLGGCGITSAPAHPQDPAKKLALAQLLLAGDQDTAPDPDGALLVTDELLKADPKMRAARVLAGRANRQLAKLGRKGITESLLIDAVRHFQVALAIDANDYQSWMDLSGAHFELSQFEDGRQAAHRAVQLTNVKGMEEACGNALIARAECGLRILLKTIRENPKEDGEDYSKLVVGTAQSVLLDYHAAKQFKPGVACLRASTVYGYMGRRSEELNELENGILRAPGHFPLHTRFLQLRAGRGQQAQAVAFYRAKLRDDGANGSLTYALGWAQSNLADKLSKDGDRDGAQRNYLAAITSFKTALEAVPHWKSFCQHWLAFDNLSLARINQTAGNLDAARGFLKTAYGHSPKVLDRDENGVPLIQDTFGAYYGGTLNHIGTSIAASRTLDALQDSLDCWMEFIDLHPNRLGWLYNNAAFTARDLGSGIEARGRRSADATARQKSAKDAMALYEKSYSLYVIAVKLSPDDARIVNDCGLMLTYHLHRDYDKARELFDRSIEIGEQVIADLPEDTPIDSRHDAEEAVGDAYQNIGQMERDQGRPFDSYKGFLVEAVKYFPYQRREAALWLRTKGVGRGRAAGGPAKVDPRNAAYAKIHAEAQKLADAKDYDGALLILDKAANKMVGLAAFHQDRGLFSFYYAKKAASSGGSAGLIDGLFGDARSNLQKAVELDGERVEPRLQLAQANYESGEFVNAAKISESLLNHISSVGGTTPALLAETHKVRAQAGNQVFVDAKINKGDNPAELRAARSSFRALEQMGNLDLALRKQWTVLERWAGNNDGAMEIFTRALNKSPNDQAVLAAYVAGANAIKRSANAAKALANRKDALGLWYLGMTHYYSAFETEDSDADAKLAESIARLGRGIKRFEASELAKASYKASCRQWIAMCQGTQGFMTLDAKDHGKAQGFFLAAAATAPDRVTATIYGNRSVKSGIEAIVDLHYRNDDLGAAIKTLQAACAVIKNDAGLSNNLGLFARDHGEAVEKDGKLEEAKALFEVSHDAYRNSVSLEPKSLRQRNDLIVVLLYHVKRDLDFAKQTLLDCIAESAALLEDPEGDEQDVQDLNETVGDCYQNLGYYYLTFGKDAAKARMNLEKSLTFHPFKERRAVAYLKQLDQDNKK